jgi:hypothetical protein
MASFFFNADSTTAQTLADGEFGFIAEGASLDVNGDAVTATGNVSVTVAGSLAGTSNALSHSSGALVLHVGDGGRVDGGSDAVAASSLDSCFVVNSGRITSAEDGLDLSGDGPITIRNDGLIRGESDGIIADSGTGLLEIINRGTIRAVVDQGVDHNGGPLRLVNFGTIESLASLAIDGGDSRQEIDNRGTVRGNTALGANDDSVVNRGTMDRVALGGGDDFYVGRGQGSADSVDAGGGFDVLVSSRADDSFIGGGAADFFVFERRGGADRIEDFARQDVISLVDFDLSGFSELRPLIEDRPNGVLIDLSDQGQTIFLAGIDKADLRANDFIFEPILM